MKQESEPRLERSELELLLAIRQHGSLASTAQAAGVVPSVITKRLAAIERRFQLKLFHRSTRRLSVTAEGDLLCVRARPLLEEFRALEGELRERHAQPAGEIRLASSFGFGRICLGPALAEFQQAHPEVRVDLRLAERLPDLAGERLDGAVWLWAVAGQRAAEWSGRRLARNQRVLVAAPEYLRRQGTPATPQELAQHDCLLVREHEARPDVWQLRRERERIVHTVPVRGSLTTNSGELARDWCLAGRGILLRSLWDVGALIESGALRRVLPEYAMTDADVLWLAPRQARVPRRVRLLVDFLAGRWRAEPWIKAWPASAPPGSRRSR